jgi:hypothetical protein
VIGQLLPSFRLSLNDRTLQSACSSHSARHINSDSSKPPASDISPSQVRVNPLYSESLLKDIIEVEGSDPAEFKNIYKKSYVN